MRIGAEYVLQEYGSRLAVAEALILGKLNSHQQQFACDLVDKTIMEAARIRIELGLNKKLEEKAKEKTDG